MDLRVFQKIEGAFQRSTRRCQMRFRVSLGLRGSPVLPSDLRALQSQWGCRGALGCFRAVSGVLHGVSGVFQRASGNTTSYLVPFRDLRIVLNVNDFSGG